MTVLSAMVDKDEVATGRIAFPPVILRVLKLATATAMARVVARTTNNLQLLQMLTELANDTLDMAPQAYRKQKLNFAELYHGIYGQPSDCFTVESEPTMARGFF